MKRPKFQKLCSAVAAGEDKFVANTRNHLTGKLIACMEDSAEIDIFGRKQTWIREECKEFFLPNLD